MGFHTRHISESSLKAVYRSSGVKGILQTFSADAIVTSDNFSSQVTSIFEDYSKHRDHDLLEQQIETFFSAN